MNKNNSKDGSIFYRKDRKIFVYQYYETDPYSGKKNRKVKSFKTRAEAEDYKESLNYQMENPIYIEHNGLPLGELMKLNLNNKLNTNQISQAQYDRVRMTQKKIEKSYLYNKKIDEIKPEEIQAFLNSFTNLSNSSIKKLKEQFSQAFKYAIARGYIKIDPMSTIIIPKSTKKDKKVRALTFPEQEQFVEWLLAQDLNNFPYRNIYLIQMFCGLRVGEVLALQTSDIDLLRKKIKVSKTLTILADGSIAMSDSPKTEAGNREVTITPFIMPYIIEQINFAKSYPDNKENLLFIPLKATKNKYVDRENVNHTLKTVLKREFGIEGITTHSLRHTYGTRCIEAGMQPSVVQKNMGHTDISVTLNVYTDVFDDFKKSEQDKFNEYFIKNSSSFKKLPYQEIIEVEGKVEEENDEERE